MRVSIASEPSWSAVAQAHYLVDGEGCDDVRLFVDDAGFAHRHGEVRLHLRDKQTHTHAHAHTSALLDLELPSP